MSLRRLLFFYLKIIPVKIVILSLFLSCSSGEVKNYPGSGSLVDETSYKGESLENLSLFKTIDFNSDNPIVIPGDVTGDNQKELILVFKNSIRIIGNKGELLTEKSFGNVNFHSVITADTDNDGKEEIIAGLENTDNARFLVINGFLNTIQDNALLKISKAQTSPQWFSEGSLYLTAYSWYHSSPKVVIKYDLKSRKVDWVYKMGPLPTGLFSASNNDLLISNRAVSQDKGLQDESVKSDRKRQAFFRLSPEGKEIAYIPFGPETKEGYFVKDGISGFKIKAADLNGDGDQEYVTLVERFSELYEGPCLIQIRDEEGNIKKEIEGPSETEATFGFIPSGNKKEIVVAWESAGEIWVLDENLKIEKKLKLTGTNHKTRLYQIGRFSGKNDWEILVSDFNKLYVLDINLQTRFMHIFRNNIYNAFFTPGSKERANLTVMADSLYFFKPSSKPAASVAIYTNPPGADLYLDGKKVEPTDLPVLHNLKEGEHEVYAALEERKTAHVTIKAQRGKTELIRLDIPGEPVLSESLFKDYYTASNLDSTHDVKRPLKSFSDLKLLEEASLPEGFYPLMLTGDFTGDERKEICIYDLTSLKTVMFNDTLSKIGSFQFTSRARSKIVPLYGGLSGKGKDDLLLTEFGGKTAEIFTGSGELLYSKNITYSYDSYFFVKGVSKGNLFLNIGTGYLKSPRGLYSVSIKNRKINYFYPVAIRIYTGGFVHENGISFPTVFTGSNGAEIKREGVPVEKDTEYFIHAIPDDGSFSSTSGPAGTEDPHGFLFVFGWDTDGESAKEIYYLDSKMPGYYEGDSGIYRLDTETGKLKKLFTGPYNGQAGIPSLIKYRGQTCLGVRWFDPNYIDIFDSKFNHLARHSYNPEIIDRFRYQCFVDFDGDGNSEFLIKDGEYLKIFSIEGDPLAALSLKNRDSKLSLFYRVEDIDNDGKAEIIIIGDKSLEIYGY